jgi:hypothetical protein
MRVELQQKLASTSGRPSRALEKPTTAGRKTVRSRRPQHVATGSVPLTELQNRLGHRLWGLALGEVADAWQ